ncbi:hypothetical protein BCR34DRAFT_225680 [Clohesyomyces aquaticus]|uniref:Uncharacterized protein n=1 Tax=Clohesyomyces aquaticus TaxID=1231657 RepID=A0A1Y1Y8W9_9PLEO|nr:hypothetical protein BCR34DRAFT_225680 [Clohesyomyces aquaticus]
MVFIHGHQKHKHGTRAFEGIDYDNVEAIKALKIDFVQKAGYANLRCMSKPGCPAEIQPFRPDEERDPLRPQENAMATAWSELFGNNNVPQVIATPCCAQFAVSRATVLQRSQQEYESFLDWIYNTPLDNFTSGRIFEYLLACYLREGSHILSGYGAMLLGSVRNDINIARPRTEK